MNKTLYDLANEGNRIIVIAIDETKFWKDEIAKKAKKIHGVYIVNLTEPTHNCSIEVDYPAECIRNEVQNPEPFGEDELTELELQEGIDGEIRYFGRWFNNFRFLKAYNDADDTEESVREYESGNPNIFTMNIKAIYGTEMWYATKNKSSVTHTNVESIEMTGEILHRGTTYEEIAEWAYDNGHTISVVDATNLN